MISINKLSLVTLALGGAVVALSADMSAAAQASSTPGETRTIAMKGAKGEDMGSVMLSPLANGVKLKLDLMKLPAGTTLAFHIHEKGKCIAPKFESAGGHFAPGKNAHGFDMTGGPHAGDLPNLEVSAQGTVKAEFVATGVSMSKADNSLLKKDGTALVIHAKADDYKSQPSGAAGDRIACGEIL